MKNLTYIFFIASLLFFSFESKAQCNTATSICSQGVAGPFVFSNSGPQVSTCLDFTGPGYAYIVLYITQSGPLELLIDGNASSGYLDVAIFLIPPGEDPCVAIQNTANQISCNYASSPSGCNQIGTYFSCVSSIPSPQVTAGDKLMIVVENWSGVSSNFIMDLAPAPAAQSGPGNSTIISPGAAIYTSSSQFQMNAVDNGGVWSGIGITPGGVFDPSISGQGVFTITYILGVPPCDETSTYDITVNSPLSVEMKTIDIVCEDDQVSLIWETASQLNCDYFCFERSTDGYDFQVIEIIDGLGTTSELQHYVSSIQYDFRYEYYRLVEVDFNGERTVYGPFFRDCGTDPLIIYPSPTTDLICIKFMGFNLSNTELSIYDALGKIVMCKQAELNKMQQMSLKELSAGVYTFVAEDSFHKEKRKLIKL
ncbi:MAG: T9SS type A sorting domain-containing protein [Crocinitomicaceae bacterium]|nr:T9SS type A sorting domain-containing protein [Flavobacteriales bacterium]NQZ34652.1 T9SS type A sorting domain-containing protein [Crocinitomicaceae bacterium]